jgi:hypothetical protein
MMMLAALLAVLATVSRDSATFGDREGAATRLGAAREVAKQPVNGYSAPVPTYMGNFESFFKRWGWMSTVPKVLGVDTRLYDPTVCQNMVNGHCQDENGGAWSYKNPNGDCSHTESSVPRDGGLVAALPSIFPNVQSVMDFGGGIGAYLTSFRDAGLTKLVSFEPHDLGKCLFRGLKQSRFDIMNSPLSACPHKQFDLVMTIEVLEHIPAKFHPHAIQFLIQASKQWIVFSAAHPGQDGEGHVGPSMKTRQEWIQAFLDTGDVVFNQQRNEEFHKHTGGLLTTNAFVLQKKGQ